MGFQESGHGRPHPLFIATQANRAIGPLELLSMRSLDMSVPDIGHGGDLPNGQIPTASWGTGQGDGGTALGVAMTT